MDGAGHDHDNDQLMVKMVIKLEIGMLIGMVKKECVQKNSLKEQLNGDIWPAQDFSVTLAEINVEIFNNIELVWHCKNYLKLI